MRLNTSDKNKRGETRMPYTNIDRCYHISRYASYKYDEKITEAQLREAIVMIIRSKNEKAIERFIKEVLADNASLAKPQFKKKDGYYFATPNKPKTPNQLIAEAYEEREAEKMLKIAKKAKKDLAEKYGEKH